MMSVRIKEKPMIQKDKIQNKMKKKLRKKKKSKMNYKRERRLTVNALLIGIQ